MAKKLICWKKGVTITGGNNTKEQTYHNLQSKLEVSVTKWGKNLLHFPDTTVFLYKNNKQFKRKNFSNKKSANKFAKNYMDKHDNC